MCGTESKQRSTLKTSFVHKRLLANPPLHTLIDQLPNPIKKIDKNNHIQLTPQHHNTTIMPDQVKYANKLQGKNVLVIGGSSGMPSHYHYHQILQPKHPTNTNPSSHRHRLQRRRSLTRIRLHCHNLLLQPRPRLQSRPQTPSRLPLRLVPNLRPRLQLERRSIARNQPRRPPRQNYRQSLKPAGPCSLHCRRRPGLRQAG
jgi:hypothetical protein